EITNKMAHTLEFDFNPLHDLTIIRSRIHAYQPLAPFSFSLTAAAHYLIDNWHTGRSVRTKRRRFCCMYAKAAATGSPRRHFRAILCPVYPRRSTGYEHLGKAQLPAGISPAYLGLPGWLGR